ncbi:hypothetical protein NBH00_23920 [Paraconexibacter antarcticus]|uniref:Uncharacterized protein n=1 Tax=Paraconexibacter antarcticus TaxID=2949664 RepID=A0ABY5DTG6_9ACTN|nr:hypothetical protein [Paraconexibacter antarcticus]UTI64372.1 hypothetical protein NBH00_23920 [Paraconexibacter antarcticus]
MTTRHVESRGSHLGRVDADSHKHRYRERIDRSRTSAQENALQSVLAAKLELSALADGDTAAFDRLRAALDAASDHLYRATERPRDAQPDQPTERLTNATSRGRSRSTDR